MIKSNIAIAVFLSLISFKVFASVTPPKLICSEKINTPQAMGDINDQLRQLENTVYTKISPPTIALSGYGIIICVTLST